MSENKRSKMPGDSIQAVIEVYKKDVDRTLIRQNLKLTVEKRLINLQQFVQFAAELRKADKMIHETSSITK